jgi:hypothetical protein
MIKKFENFVNESQMKVKRSDEEVTNILKRIARVQFYKYLSDSTLSELKKHYNDNKFDRRELKIYLSEIGLESERHYEAFINRLGLEYTFEEFKKISEILFNAFGRKNSGYVCSILKVLFEPISADDFERDYEDKLDALRVRRIYKVKDKDIPIVIGINGKPLTGVVYYNEFLDIYTETEDEMREAINKFISSSFYKGIEMIDDYNIDNFSQVKNYSKVNLEE